MRYILLICFSVSLISCTNKEKNTTEKIKYYPFSLDEIIYNEVNAGLASVDSAVKWVSYSEEKIEKGTISVEDVKNDILSFLEFDLNKPAWQNSFVSKEYNGKTRFISKDEHLPIQYVEITGLLNSPTHVRIYFRNTNNLYESVKIIEWEIGRYYSVYSKQDVKGMDPDYLFIKTYY